MTRPRTFYVLGAGTSANLVPFTAELREEVKRAYWQLGMFPASPALPTDLFARVIGGYRGRGLWDSPEIALLSITPGALNLLVQKMVSYDLRQAIPPQYSFLQRVAAPSLFFNFNLDGLASAYLRPCHIVMEPHGSADREWTEAPEFDRLLELTREIELPHLSSKLLPGPEPATITGTEPYVDARPWLQQAPATILLGYSFGKNPEGFDDAESFEYITEHLKATNCTVFVVSPDPFELVALIEQRIRAKRVLPVAMYWDTFTEAAMLTIRQGQYISDWVCEEQIGTLEYAYLDALEARPVGQPLAFSGDPWL